MKHKNHSYKHNEQTNNQNINNSECFGVNNFKIYPEMTSQYFFEKIWFWLIIKGFFYMLQYFWQNVRDRSLFWLGPST